MPCKHDVALTVAQLLSSSDANLFLHEINAGHHFRDRVLNLNARIHFNEIELACFIEKFESTRTTVTNLAAGLSAAVADFFDQLARNTGRWRFFDYFLMAALHRAVALAQPDRILEFISQYLDFHVARIFQILLHIDFRITECSTRFGFRHRDRIE